MAPMGYPPPPPAPPIMPQPPMVYQPQVVQPAVMPGYQFAEVGAIQQPKALYYR